MISDKALKFIGNYVWKEYSGFYFGAVHEPKNNTIDNYKNIVSCRDGLGAVMRTGIIEGDLQTDKLRILFVWDKITNPDQWAQRGLSVIHIMEKLAGWPLTRAMAVEVGRNNVYSVYCRASRRWLKSPYLTTLYILLMRMSRDENISGFKTFDDMEKILLSISRFNSDDNNIRNTLPYWKALMVGYPEIFEKRKITYYWSLDRLNTGTNGYGEGILRLCDGSTQFKEAHEALMKVHKNLKASK